MSLQNCRGKHSKNDPTYWYFSIAEILKYDGGLPLPSVICLKTAGVLVTVDDEKYLADFKNRNNKILLNFSNCENPALETNILIIVNGQLTIFFPSVLHIKVAYWKKVHEGEFHHFCEMSMFKQQLLLGFD